VQVLFGSSCLHPREQGKLGGVAKFVWNLLSGWLTSFFSRRTFKFYLITDNDPSKGAGSDWACDMDILFGLIASGKIDPVIDSVLPLSEVGSALAKLDDKGTRGKVVIDCTLSN
jgi:NADPH:quinone reductase-like Zn-dependent oxidoreductase